MRPQHNAAENLAFYPGKLKELLASMRPQHNAAENMKAAPFQRLPMSGFNEAAA